MPFFAAGVESNEFCAWVMAEPLTETEAKDALRRAMPDFDRLVADRRVEIMQSRTWYFTGDTELRERHGCEIVGPSPL